MLGADRTDSPTRIAEDPRSGVADGHQTGPARQVGAAERCVAADQDEGACRCVETGAAGAQGVGDRGRERIAGIAQRDRVRRRRLGMAGVDAGADASPDAGADPASGPPAIADCNSAATERPSERHSETALTRDSCSSRAGLESASRSPPVRTSAMPARIAAARRIVPTSASPFAATCRARPPYQPRGPASRSAIAASARRRGVPVTITGAAVATIASQASTPSRSRPPNRSTVWTTVASAIGRRRSCRRSEPGSQSGARSLRSASVQTASDAASTSSLISCRND